MRFWIQLLCLLLAALPFAYTAHGSLIAHWSLGKGLATFERDARGDSDNDTLTAQQPESCIRETPLVAILEMVK
jgi:hypothetical protein